MRTPIRQLPDHLVDQIAAGEVVERPASVVKELSENAIDAGATHVRIDIEAGGKKLIRVIDNGSGMDKESAELCLRRHATSKITSIDDLFGVRSFGFRGEALPSIASVSRMQLTTRERDSNTVSAYQLDLEGGSIVERSEVGAPYGTTICVRDLLYNVPVRQKFLKGESTETSHITDAVLKLALAHPEVHFHLQNGKRRTLQAPVHTSREQRVRHLMGARLGEQVSHAHSEYSGVAVDMYLGAPSMAQSTTRGLQVFVGNRSVRDRGILHALMQGHQERLPRGRYPVCVVFVDLPGCEVDVNVHPQKLEVRFSDPQLVHAAVRQVVRQALEGAEWQDDGDELSPTLGKARPSQLQVIASQSPPQGASALAASLAKQRRGRMSLPWYQGDRPRYETQSSRSDAAGRSEHAGEARANRGDYLPSQGVGQAGRRSTLGEGRRDESGTRGSPDPIRTEDGVGRVDSKVVSQAVSEIAPPGSDPTFFRRLRYLGQLDCTYLLCEADGELVMLDQHCAHERVEFDRLLERYRERKMPVQRLLFPSQVRLSNERAKLVESHGDSLSAVGFELDEFGKEGGLCTFALKAVPSGLREGQAEDVLFALLGELEKNRGGHSGDRQVEAMLATLACHSVVRAGDRLAGREVESLLAAMDEVDFQTAAPHGRPVLLRVPVSEIARRFGR